MKYESAKHFENRGADCYTRTSRYGWMRSLVHKTNNEPRMDVIPVNRIIPTPGNNFLVVFQSPVNRS